MILINVLIVLLVVLILLSIGGVFKRFLVYVGLRRREGLEMMPTGTNKITSAYTAPSYTAPSYTAPSYTAPANNSNSNSNSYTDPGLNNDPLYLAKLNAANISYLKDQVDKLSGLKEQVNTLNTQTENNSTAINGIGQQLTLTSQQVTGRDPNSTEPLPTVTGLD